MIKTAIPVCVLTLLLGLVFYFGQQSYRSTSFAGPEFHSLDEVDLKAVHSELSRYLSAEGFEPSESPAGIQSKAGIYTAGAVRTWFVKRGQRTQATYICVDLEKVTVRTTMKWEARGSKEKLQSAERFAYTTALDLDRWFDRLKEKNILSLDLREKKRRDFESHLAENN